MNATRPTCRDIEADLVALASGEAAPPAAQVVERHIARCGPCRDELQRYRRVEGLVSELRQAAIPGMDPTLARAELESRLADLKSRLVAFGDFASPLGPILIARSELGVSMVEYLPSAAAAASRLARLAGADAVEDEARTGALYRDLLDYLQGRRTELDWPLDLRWARSDFQRRVLEATAALPYGAVASYAGIAARIGAPSAVRPVAQALRWNPLPIVIPCHRVIGSSGALTGYAGRHVGLKQRLLAVEGVKTVAVRDDFKVNREAMYTMVTGDQEYCVPTCGSLLSRSLSTLTLFAARERAEAAGFSPCGSCRPDLHPLPA